MFKVRCFVGAITATAGMTFGMYGVIFLMPLVWQTTGRLDAVGAGLALLPMALVFVAVSPFSGSLRTRFGTRLVTAGGVAIIGAGLLTVAASAGLSSLVLAEIGLALTGLGMGFATGPLMGAAVDAFDAARSGTAAALINVARMAGATIGVAILGAIFAHAGSGEGGLQLAMIVGGAVQITAAAVAWKTVTPAH
jgi:MFS family permease